MVIASYLGLSVICSQETEVEIARLMITCVTVEYLSKCNDVWSRVVLGLNLHTIIMIQ